MLDLRIALVSKNEQRLEFLELACRMHGFFVERFGKMPPIHTSYDLMIWDADSVHLPQVSVPNMVTLSSTAGEQDRMLTWPVSLAKIETLLFSFSKSVGIADARVEDNTVRVYHRDMRQIAFSGSLLTLSDYEMRLLERLCTSSGEAVTREELNRLLGAENGHIADVYVHHLRRKLAKVCGKGHIQTVRGVGYRTDLIWTE